MARRWERVRATAVVARGKCEERGWRVASVTASKCQVLALVNLIPRRDERRGFTRTREP